jgi:uncharacterized iron-regulated protein
MPFMILSNLFAVPLVLLTLLIATISGCATMHRDVPKESFPATQYDAVLLQLSSRQPLNIDELASKLEGIDVVIVGEYHGHHASHLLQSSLQAALYRQNPKQVLTMEQFELESQLELNRYTEGKSGESEMMEDTAAWDNYRASYRPLVEFARTRDIPVLAANAPADIVRCIGQKGPDYLDTLDEERRRRLPQKPFVDTPAYEEKFIAAVSSSHGAGDPSTKERIQNIYHAQLLRDNTMAMRILDARRAYPDHQILHVTGTFHSEERLGTVAMLESRAPEISVTVISPVFWRDPQSPPPIEEHRLHGDFLYFIQPLPVEFRDPERKRAATNARFSQSTLDPCN